MEFPLHSTLTSRYYIGSCHWKHSKQRYNRGRLKQLYVMKRTILLNLRLNQQNHIRLWTSEQTAQFVRHLHFFVFQEKSQLLPCGDYMPIQAKAFA